MNRLRLSARTAAVVTVVTALFPWAASAQSTAAPTRVRATINAVHSTAVDVTDASGNKATVTLPVDINVTQVAPIEPSAIRAGSYIGTAAVKEPDGTLRALEVHVFPEAMRGTGDGHRPYDMGPNSSMTNGTVEQAGAVTGAQGRTLSRTTITSFGRAFAVASTLYERPSAPGKIGRQMQTWVKFAEGWRVVAAHVSLIDAPAETGA